MLQAPEKPWLSPLDRFLGAELLRVNTLSCALCTARVPTRASQEKQDACPKPRGRSQKQPRANPLSEAVELLYV